MKTPKLLLLLAGLVLVVSACGKKGKFKDAKEYNDYIVDRVDVVTSGIDKLGDAMENLSPSGLDSLRSSILDSAKATSKILSEMEDWEKDEKFRKSALAMVNVYEDVLQNDYPALFKMLKDMEGMDEDENMDSLFSSMEELVEKVDKKINDATDIAQKAQSEFGDKHNLTILPDNTH